MISFLQGKIVLKSANFVILETNGVGYKVALSDKNLEKTKQGQDLKVFCFTRIREPLIELYGFLSFEELQLFETLQGISGVGPKTAMLLTGFKSLENLKQSFENQPDDFHQQVKGIGKKKLQKIILEITGKIKELKPIIQKQDEALDALINLGFDRQTANQALEQIPKEIQIPEEKIKQALKILGKQKNT